jgi:transaldolase / glucose-6-phosphate isomerase
VRTEGFTDALLLGMGGSSLAPELFGTVFAAPTSDRLRLHVLDSTDPDEIWAHAERLDPTKTLVIVATKSGGTEETLSLFKFFHAWAVQALGPERAGHGFVAITDPGSRLESMANEQRFRETFLNDPNIGGRYAALSHFGLVPAALVGVEVGRLLDRGLSMMERCRAQDDNEALWLGAALAEFAAVGRDKATFVISPEVASFADWVEQLIAESTGKRGTGILPVAHEPLGPPSVYGEDRAFFDLRIYGDRRGVDALDALQRSGHPVVRLTLADRYDLGGQFFLWELATAIAGHRLGIHPFDQPDVEAAKVRAREAVQAYRETGQLSEDASGEGAPASLREFLGSGRPGDYVSLQAYVMRTAATDDALRRLQIRIRDTYRLATTVGYGPRFLHSTGQLHKGDRGRGLFVQLLSEPARDAPIPDQIGGDGATMTFDVLKRAQALGDRQALASAGRRVIRFHLGTDVEAALERLVSTVS